MTLRDHPLMKRKSGYCSWPPVWTTTRLDPNDKPTGEIGILQQVLTNYLLTTRVFLFIDYQGHRYMGAMEFDDPKFCNVIFSVLHSHIGYSLTQIGDLDLPQTL